MANTCYSYFIVVGDSKELRDLYDKMNYLNKMDKPLLANNGYGQKWLGCLIALCGGNWMSWYCRGIFGGFHLNEDETELTFDTETPWREPYEFIEFLESVYPSLKFYFTAEEGSYNVTNDYEGKYFPVRYVVHKIRPHCEDVFEYTEEQEKEFYDKVASYIGGSYDNIDDVEDAVYEYNETHDDDIEIKVYQIITRRTDASRL